MPARSIDNTTLTTSLAGKFINAQVTIHLDHAVSCRQDSLQEQSVSAVTVGKPLNTRKNPREVIHNGTIRDFTFTLR